MKYKYLLFDFDGVIADTFKVSREAQTLNSRPVSDDEYRALFNGNVYESLSEKTKEEYVPPQYSEDDPLFRVYTPKMLACQPIAGMREVLRDLSAGHVLSLITSSLDTAVQAYLNRYDLTRHFSQVMGVNVHQSKVAKINMICDIYDGRPEECLFITDTLGDLREANKAGVGGIGVSWGFHDVETLKQGNPVAIVHTPQELFEKISGF